MRLIHTTFSIPTILLMLIFLLALMLRVWFVSGDNVVFFWDQARDALVSRSIYEQGDVKILGPSASGTGDQVYHGVLFYYLIGPLYVLFGGNPTLVTMVLGAVNALGVFVMYRLGNEVLGSKRVGLVAALLFAVSANAVFFGTWLSNPMFAPLTIGLFYLYLYKAVCEHQPRAWIWTSLFLGLTHQWVIFTLYLWLPVIGGLLWMYHQRTLKKIALKMWVLSGVTYVVTVGSMILGQLMLWQRGILTSGALPEASAETSAIDGLVSIVTSYIRVFAQSGLPTYSILSSVVAMVCLMALYRGVKHQSQKVWMVLFLTAPLMLLLVMIRRDGHTLVGISLLVYLAVAYVAARLSRFGLYKVLLGFVLTGYLVMNVSYLAQQKEYGDHPFVLQKGVTVNDAKAMVDMMYEEANGEIFSVSSLTNPLGMNTTWAYFFDWYGKAKYGYVPVFVGPTQTGLFGEGLMEESNKPLPLHFAIREPDDIIREDFVEAFLIEQESWAGKPKRTERSRELFVDVRVNQY